MKNFIISLLVTLLVMITTQVAKPKEVRHDPAPIKRQSIIQPLQAKAYAQKQPVAPVAPKASPVASTTVSGTHEDWMRQAGIPESLWGYVDYIVSRESGWNPCSYYPSHSDCSANPSRACGLVMQNPCHKIPGDWRDPVAALRWQYGYVNGRYGGYAQAVAHWKIHHNY